MSMRVVVVGGGLAGLTAALHLAERGLEVVLCEAHPAFLGGRTRARPPYYFRWQGRTHAQSFDHGQHCLWTQYWNMRALLNRLGISTRSLRSCDTTRYLYDDGRAVHRLEPFDVNPANPRPTLLHFLAHMRQATRVPGWTRSDTFRLATALPRLAAAWSFAHREHYDAWDRLSVQELFAWLGLPAQMEEVFKSMCKASTFHAHGEISASWGLSMVESTMMGHPDDHKMWCFRGNLGTHLIDPLAEALRQRGGRILRNATAAGIERSSAHISAVLVTPTKGRLARSPEVLGEPMRLACDAVVAATDIPGFQRWLLPALADVPEIRASANLEAVGSFVARLVLARPLRDDDPPLGIFAGRFRVADTYFRLSKYQDEFIQFSSETGGEVLEVHAYLAARELAASPASVARALLLDELVRAWPELATRVIHVALASNERTFDKQGVGHGRFQPAMRTAIPNLVLSGSWIRTDRPVHDMEKAVVTGLEAANALLERHGSATFPIWPLRGGSILQRAVRWASVAFPKPPGVRAALGRAHAGATFGGD
jgi:isorenieratene synthase